MLTPFIVLVIVKMCYEQWKEDKIMRRIEEYEKHYYERPPLD